MDPKKPTGTSEEAKLPIHGAFKASTLLTRNLRAGGTRMGNCVVPESLAGEFLSISLCSTALPTCLHLPLGTGESWPGRDLQSHLVHPLSLQIQKLSLERGTHSPRANSCWGGTVINDKPPNLSQESQQGLSPSGGLVHMSAVRQVPHQGSPLREQGEKVSQRMQPDRYSPWFPVLAGTPVGWFGSLHQWRRPTTCLPASGGTMLVINLSWLSWAEQEGGEWSGSVFFSWPAFRLKLGLRPQLRPKIYP